MFFEARERFAQNRPNEYVRGLLSQYGNRGKPIQLNRPTHMDHQQALAFRQRELEEMRLAKERAKYLEAQLTQSRRDARILAQYARQFLAQPPNDHRRDGPPDGHTRSTPVLHTASRPTDADDATRTQEINSSPIVEVDDGRGVASSSGPGAPVVLEKKSSAKRGHVQPRSVRAADDGEREPEGAADHTGPASEHVAS